jgi:hypothetical protein
MNEIKEALKKLALLKCERTWRGYATAVFLDFGKQTSENSEYSICLNVYCDWVLFKNENILAISDDPYEDMETGLKNFEGEKIEIIDVQKKSLQTIMIFSNDLKIKINHKKPKSEWSLKTPKKYISVGQNCVLKTENKNFI